MVGEAVYMVGEAVCMLGEVVYMFVEAVCMVGGSSLQARKFYLGIWAWHR